MSKIKSEKRSKIIYMSFINKLVKDKIEINNKNREKIKNLYSELVNKKFNNIDRVYKRVLRGDVRNEFLSNLKELNMGEKEYRVNSEKLLNIRRKKLEIIF